MLEFVRLVFLEFRGEPGFEDRVVAVPRVHRNSEFFEDGIYDVVVREGLSSAHGLDR